MARPKKSPRPRLSLGLDKSQLSPGAIGMPIQQINMNYKPNTKHFLIMG